MNDYTPPQTPASEPDGAPADDFPTGAAARRAARLRRAAERRHQPASYTRPVWRTLARGWEEPVAPDAVSLAQAERWRPRDRYADRNTEAEYDFYRVPGRFQRYAAEYLFANERILAFVPWTAELTESWWSRVGRFLAPGARQAPQGALVITDRQVLLLRDDEQPVAGTLFWGYTAHAATYERLAAVALRDEERGRVRLRLYLRACGGGEIVEWLFPAHAADAVRSAATLLREFLPRAGDTRLRRQSTIMPLARLAVAPPPEMSSPEVCQPGTLPGRLPGRQRATLETGVTLADRAALAAALEAALTALPNPSIRPRRVYASAVAPGTHPRASPRVVAVTQSHVLVVPLSGEGTPAAFPVAHITSAELRHSPLGYHVAWTLAGRHPAAARRMSLGTTADRPKRELVAFPLRAYSRFLPVFAALRQALALLPVAAEGPDLATGTGTAGDAFAGRI